MSEDRKRKEPPPSNAIVPSKKARTEGEIVAVGEQTSTAIVAAGEPRTSSLQAPIMLLTGHQVH